MDRVWIFYSIQLAASAYAILRGGAPERLTGLALLLAAVSTGIVERNVPSLFSGLELGVMIVDLMLLAVMIGITLSADRFWPAWVTALHALGTGAHLARAISPDVIRLVYALLSAAWSYPIVLLLVIGTARHSRRIRARGWDLDWSRQDPTMR
ncbi:MULTISPECIES: hypothetical protein [unclassified Sphingomonas]|uniref:hypothetical protein n=1 Tax=unclassified Sphingomonas TaxID=196159 RepID=UPI0006F9BDD7|nr:MULTISPECIES: hypothetical protein [unclassified Sphingomonas]KQO06836.1 hypothetical protein ASF09_11230 [Sphingomonas sp. Leaf242]KQS49539.1 hypothetical protein ASG20_11145 [Sphingomonas sp. Leaf198]RMB36802.1 hypothetical protein C8J47_0378 [Sphingomonas sp. PP-F2F-G114-C0414]RMB54477.1 hypothetical protein C8J44_2098 [Sphingomonas sp. PP-CE-3A-406]TCP71085.1 hypothetical protein C8J43_102157 [Sphingomonas sp. PP-CE-1G-424]